MLTEKGTLPVGVEYDGTIHKDFELREQIVRDSVELFDDTVRSKRAASNVQYAATCILASQIVSLGSIPKEAINGDLLLDMHQDDFMVLREADERLEERRDSFRVNE